MTAFFIHSLPMKPIFCTLFLFLLALTSHAQLLGSSGDSPETKASLIPEFSTVAKGESFYLYLSLEHPPGWYAYYYNNTLSSTIRPSFDVVAPEGVSVGALEFPVPTIKESFGIPSYVFIGKTYYRLPVQVTDTFQGDTLTLNAAAGWQICKESCLPPENKELSLTLPIAQRSSINPAFSNDLTKGFSSSELTNLQAQYSADGLSLTFAESATNPKFYDFDGQTAFGAVPTVTQENGKTTLLLPLDQGNDFRTEITPLQENFRGYLVTDTSTAWIDTPLQKEGAVITEKQAPKAEPESTKSDILTLPSDEELAKLYDPSVPILQGSGYTIWLALGGAFLGGILLNLMPCVFPVLSLKVLSFVEKAGEESWKVRLHGLLFTLGVVLSMWALALALFAVKQTTGQSINWGQQMSYPTFVGVVIIILFLFGLNMAGVFEFGTKLTSVGGTTKTKNEYTGTILSGVLTTVIATPCSGPFLGAAMSYTLSQPLFIALVLFTVFALGISFPYLLLSFFPALTSKLPRPGAWMETLKVILSFGMFAAAAFFMQTFAALTGGAGLSFLIMALVVIGLAAYFYGHWSLPHLSKKVRFGLGFGLSLLVLVIGLGMSWQAATKYKAPLLAEAKETKGITWLDWRPGIVEYLRGKGYHVWVDYTAVWCATCQVNKKVVFGNEDFVSSLDKSKLIFVKADMTNHDSVITTDLARAERVAIPVNIVYAPDTGKTPILLENLITVDDAKEALGKINF